MLELKELREKRVKLVADARTYWTELDATRKKENRDATVEERTRYDTMMDDVDKLKDEITGIETKAADEVRSQRLTDEEAALDKPEKRQTGPDKRETQEKPGKVEAREFVFEKRGCHQQEHRLSLPVEQGATEYRKAFDVYLRTGSDVEWRALQKDVDTTGGYLSAPQLFQATLIKAIDNRVFMRGIGNMLPPLMTAESLGAPSLDADPADPTWTSEIDTGNEDSTMAFGKRELNPHPLAEKLKVSKTLIRRSALDAESIVRDRLAYKMGIKLENAYLNGSGSNQPLGVFTASDDGISTGRDVSTGNTDTEMRFDGLKNVAYSLKGGHRDRSTWIFHRDGIKQLSKLKDGEGRYIWMPGVTGTEGDTLLSRPVEESEYSPNTFTASQYVGILGNFEHYWMVDALTMTIQVLLELYAATNQNGYFIRSESDGMPVLEEAFARVKLGS